MKFDSLNSTNSFADSLITKTGPPEGSAIIADFQTDGKGQFGRTWNSEKGKNLTFSLIFYPNFLSPDKGFLLNVLVSQSIIEVLEVENIPNCSIKWPNDIVKGDKKLGGILIKTSIQKNAIQSAVIGVGLNINQVNFPENAGDPVSMKLISGESFSIENIFERICDRIEENYISLENGRYSQLMKSYNGHLYGCGKLVYANLNEKELILGTLDNVDIHGRITLIIDGKKETYSYPEIRLMNNRKQ